MTKSPPLRKLMKLSKKPLESGGKSSAVRIYQPMQARKNWKAVKPNRLRAFTKHDAYKSRLDLLPAEALLYVGHVLGHGARQYEPGNWKKCRDPERYVAAGMRHYAKHMKGEFIDKQSGLPHLACVATNALFALDIILNQGQDKAPMGNYFALIQKRSKKRGVVIKRFRAYTPIFNYLEERELDPAKFIIKTVPTHVKVGCTTSV